MPICGQFHGEHHMIDPSFCGYIKTNPDGSDFLDDWILVEEEASQKRWAHWLGHSESPPVGLRCFRGFNRAVSCHRCWASAMSWRFPSQTSRSRILRCRRTSISCGQRGWSVAVGSCFQVLKLAMHWLGMTWASWSVVNWVSMTLGSIGCLWKSYDVFPRQSSTARGASSSGNQGRILQRPGIARRWLDLQHHSDWVSRHIKWPENIHKKYGV